MRSLLIRLRQWTYPPELRIHPASQGSGWDELAALTAALATRCRQLSGASADPPGNTPSAPSRPAGVDKDLALGLANGLFRIKRNLDQLAAEGTDGKELRSIRRASERLRELLAAKAIECRDLTGEIYDPGRLDFEPLGPPQGVTGLNRHRIGRLERPAVALGGELIQTARGVVEKPI
jgi:hypothetical protein